MKLYRNDINMANTSNMKEHLLEELNLSSALEKVIDNFVIDSKEKLYGPVWDKVREQFDLVRDCLNERKTNSSELFDILTGVNKSLFGYMDEGGADIADDSKIAELEMDVQELELRISIEKRGFLVAVGMDEKGNVIYERHIDWETIHILELQVAAIKKEIEWLKKLRPTVSSTTQSVASKSFSNYLNKINSIRK